MATINFKEFGIYPEIDTTTPAVQDVRRDLADAIYKNMSGIAAHDIAFRIFRSEGNIELSVEDEMLLREFFEKHAIAWMYGSYLRNLK